MKHFIGVLYVGCALILSAIGVRAQSTNVLTPHQLKQLRLEELLKVDVTTVSRHAEPASRAAAAVEVIPGEQIERTGAASVPDALRLATGVQVSRFGGHSFAISSRGFASLAANKMQVMQDGRSLYSPLFSGVFWDGYGAMLEDIDRIEIVRGPGATMWGANAVNGVINILTKEARFTQGSLVSAGGGTEERAFVVARHGDQLGPNTFYRIYGRFAERDEMAFPGGGGARDRSREGQTGFRLDSQPSDQNQFTLQGDLYYNEFQLRSQNDAVNRDGNLLGRWTHHFSADSELQWQLFYDHFERNVPGQFGEKRNTFDTDAQYRTKLGDRNELLAGVNYRVSADETKPGGTLQFSPPDETIQIFSAFVQDEVALVPERLSLVLGSKFEWESLDGFEAQPNVRLAWTPTPRQTVWAAFSRAVRMPSRVDTDVRFIPIPTNGIAFVQGNPDFNSEQVLAYELGYRVRPHDFLSVDIAGFYNTYDGLRSLEPTPPLGIPLVQQNRLDAEIWGVELMLKFQATEWWRLSANYSYRHKNLQPEPGSNDPNRGSLEGNDAPHLFSLWSSMDLPQNFRLDGVVRWVDALPNPRVPGYVELDVRLAWRPRDNLEISLVGQNLLDAQHREFGNAAPTTAEVERGFYGKVTWRF